MGRSNGSSESFFLKTGWQCGKNRLPSATPCWTPCSKTISLLCDAGVGIGKTYAYLTACILLKKFAPARACRFPAGGGSPPPALPCRTPSSGSTFHFCPGFFWRTASFKNPSGRWCEKARNALSAMSVFLIGWKR